jgi:hypothetical protein
MFRKYDKSRFAKKDGELSKLFIVHGKFCPKNEQIGGKPDSLRIPILQIIPVHKLTHREGGHFGGG